MSVARAQKEIDSQEFVWWLAYDRIDPIGMDRLEFATAVVAWTVAEIMHTKGRRPKVSDFMADYDGSLDRQKKASPQDMLAKLTTVTKRAGGTFQ